MSKSDDLRIQPHPTLSFSSLQVDAVNILCTVKFGVRYIAEDALHQDHLILCIITTQMSNSSSGEVR